MSPARILLAVLGAVLVSLTAGWLLLGAPPMGWRSIGVVGLIALLAGAAVAWHLERRFGKSLAALEAFGRSLMAPDGKAEPPQGLPRQLAPFAKTFAEMAELADARVATIEAESQQLRTVVGGMSEGVLVTDADGRVVFVNPQWRQIFRLTGEIEGASVVELSRQTALDRMLAETLESGESQQIEVELPAHPGRLPSTLILTSSPLARSSGAVVVAQDITAFLRLSEIRRDFVANVSHELKTPLSAIRGFAETLADGAKDDPKASKRFLKRILKQCTRLEALLSDLLTLSRLEHAAGRGRKAPVDLAEIVEEVIEDVEESAAKRSLTLTSEIRSVPSIDGDAGALERMCVNLLDNAVKYNREAGEVRVRLFESSGNVILEVEDSGIGIPASSVDRLFERFYRVDKGRSRKEGGTGLGLAIVKHAANLHGGNVEVESELGRGTLFRVRLPSGNATTPSRGAVPGRR